uniref:Uncharacterized protein n=1 Tax=Oryza sativa subsp. japonica TaxID=39947 RepID=Q69S46_ORYSJ|nr:hypothetical protein [Oryza sativa Japonica Group]
MLERKCARCAAYAKGGEECVEPERASSSLSRRSRHHRILESLSSTRARAELEPSLLHLRAFRQARFELVRARARCRARP